MTTPKPIDYELVATLHKQDLSAKAIAKRVGCSERSIVRWRTATNANRYSLNPHSSHPISQDRLDAAKQMLDDGASRAEVMRTLHINERTMVRHFPGRVYTPQQAGQVAIMARALNQLPAHLP